MPMHDDDVEATDHTCIHGHVEDSAPRSELEEAVDEAKAGTGLSRRSILGGLGAVASGALIASPAAAHSNKPKKGHRAPKAELVLLGTRAGPPPVPSQTGISSALVVNGAVYVVDCGRAAVTQYLAAGLKFRDLRSIFITHLHADHLADYYNFFLLGGHIPNPFGDNVNKPTPVFGPGPADGLPPKFGGGQAPTIAPDNPMPGLRSMTEQLHGAYAYSSNVFLRDMGIQDIRTLIDPREIVLPNVGATFQNTAPTMAPFEIYRDENVIVTAILVPHVMFPSFAYRFDTEYGSVTFSGDTTKTDNIPTLAHRTDILVHEAIGIEGSTAAPAVIDHMLQSHVLVGELGPVAQAAQARKLVLSHTADIAKEPIDPKAWQRAAQKGYRGTAVFGQELMRFPLG